jgi:hypothetical protein
MPTFRLFQLSPLSQAACELLGSGAGAVLGGFALGPLASFVGAITGAAVGAYLTSAAVRLGHATRK